MIRLLFAVAVGAFVLSLPIHMTALGATLRRIAGFCFFLALVPSIVVGPFFPGGVEAHPIVASAVVVILAIAAFGILQLRSTVQGGRKAKSHRIQEKTPLDRTVVASRISSRSLLTTRRLRKSNGQPRRHLPGKPGTAECEAGNRRTPCSAASELR